MIARCDEIKPITLVVLVVIKNKIARLIVTKIIIVKKLLNAINRAKVR